MADAALLEMEDAENFFVRRIASRDGEPAVASPLQNNSSSPLVLEDGLSLSGKGSSANGSDTRLSRLSDVTQSDPGHSSNDSPCGSETLRFEDASRIPCGGVGWSPNFPFLLRDLPFLPVYLRARMWRLAAKTECTKRTSNLKFFSVYIDCNPESESTLWSCDAIVEFRLISHKTNVPHFSRQFTNKFSFNSNNWGFPSFMEWNEITNLEKGYIRGDRVVVEAHIIVQKVVGVRRSPRFDFTVSQPYVCDGTFVVDGVRLHVSKAYLALYSPVFHALFFSRFSEREKKEIPIEDVILDEFIELLNVVYPSHKPVTTENVEFLLELGDKFEIQFVIDECERFLMRSDDISIATKLLWADHYSLAKLHDVCVRTFKTPLDMKALKNTEEFKSLSDATKAALFEKILKLV